MGADAQILQCLEQTNLLMNIQTDTYCKRQKDTFCKGQKDTIYKEQKDTLKALNKICFLFIKNFCDYFCIIFLLKTFLYICLSITPNFIEIVPAVEEELRNKHHTDIWLLVYRNSLWACISGVTSWSYMLTRNTSY